MTRPDGDVTGIDISPAMSARARRDRPVRLEVRADDYDAGVSVQDGGLRCSRCRHLHRVEEVVIGAALRVEGATDPADEAIVLGLICSSCRARGVLVAGYGPTADAVEAAVVTRLEDRRA